MSIQKSAAKNNVAADLEISSQKPCRCRFRNQQPWWSHFGFTSLCFFTFVLVFTFSPPIKNFILEIKGTLIDSASKFSEQTPQ